MWIQQSENTPAIRWFGINAPIISVYKRALQLPWAVLSLVWSIRSCQLRMVTGCHNAGNGAGKDDNNGIIWTPGKPGTAHKSIHRRAARVMYRNLPAVRGRKKRDLRQKNQNWTNAANGAIDNQTLQSAGWQQVGNQFTQPSDAGFNGIHRRFCPCKIDWKTTENSNRNTIGPAIWCVSTWSILSLGCVFLRLNDIWSCRKCYPPNDSGLWLPVAAIRHIYHK